MLQYNSISTQADNPAHRVELAKVAQSKKPKEPMLFIDNIHRLMSRFMGMLRSAITDSGLGGGYSKDVADRDSLSFILFAAGLYPCRISTAGNGPVNCADGLRLCRSAYQRR